MNNTKDLDKISLKNIRVYAYHGCLREEEQIGSDYLVNLTVRADLSQAAKTDLLVDTVDYVKLQDIVRQEMGMRAKLLETVAQRIVDHIFEKLETVAEVKVSVAKRNPPIGGDVAEVKVTLKKKR